MNARKLEDLIEKTGDGGCKVDEFLTGDSDLPVCVEMDDDNWDTTFLEELGNDQNFEEVAGRDSDDEEPPKLKSYK